LLFVPAGVVDIALFRDFFEAVMTLWERADCHLRRPLEEIVGGYFGIRAPRRTDSFGEAIPAAFLVLGSPYSALRRQGDEGVTSGMRK